MKLFFFVVLSIVAQVAFAQTDKKFNDTSFMQPVEVVAVRAGEKAPFAKTNFLKKDIEKKNTGQDLPFLLNQTPSVVINSDAGNGIGYTGIRIRGTDASRINVTLNGIPYNDAESQGTFFVDLPDFSSSANSIQIQRGVGTSSNGAGAFGGSINLSTNDIHNAFYAESNNSYGSYNTLKNTLQMGSGILGNHFTIDGRWSRIISDGYIDRASSHLTSFYFSPAYLNKGTSLRINIFSGKEKTYQAWNGVPENLLETDRTYNSSGTEKSGTPYENETDNYTQTHYQLFFNQQLKKYWKLNLAIFLTRGKGYYEQYKADKSFSSYGLPDYVDGTDTVKKTDLVRRLWLDNNFYGTVFSTHYQKQHTRLTFGGGWNQYDGKHYGEIVWTKVPNAAAFNYKWYNLPATKKDFSIFGKWTEQLNPQWQIYSDVQWRNVDYNISGFRDNPKLPVAKKYDFFNPKLGITYNKNSWQIYASYAVAHKEPNRDDFETGTQQHPQPEVLHDWELGIEKKVQKFSFSINGYCMYYKNQLILTGQINDVGAYTRTNTPQSYRAGIELQGQIAPAPWVNATANITFSKNKIKNFTEYVDDYDNNTQQVKNYSNTDIAFSPRVIAGGSINFLPIKNAEISLISKYAGTQFLDNSQQRNRSLDAFYVQDVRLSYTLKTNPFKAIDFFVQLNNIFNKKYEPNGYTFSYIYDGQFTTENYYFPMAPFNWVMGMNVKF